ncbi:MAG: hypothetical protein AB1393_11975 [Candidatus Edwardsbacteria bacterium]
MKRLTLAIGLLVLWSSVAIACPLALQPPPTELTGYTRYDSAIAAATVWLEQVKAFFAAGGGEFRNENGRTAIINKIEATLEMLKTGNTNGVIHKLRNDIQERLNDWLVEPQVLGGCLLVEFAAYILENPQYAAYYVKPFPPNITLISIGVHCWARRIDGWDIGCEIYIK